MVEVIRFILIGLGIGGIYALITQGVVVIYRGSGVLNFAHGALVMVGAYAHFEMSNLGFPALASITAAMAITASVAAFTHLAILRPMRGSSPLTRVVATLGLLITLQAAAVLRYGIDSKPLPSALPTRRVEILHGAPVGLDRMLLLAIGVGTTILLWAVYRWTRVGRITTAVAENERIAAALGHSPNVVATLNWILGGALAALAGCLIAPITFLQPTSLSLLVVPSLAAGLLASFTSFPIALAGSLLIGVAESLTVRYVRAPGWAASVPFIIVIVVLVMRGRGLPLRSHLLDRLPAVGSGRVRIGPTVVTFMVGAVSLLWLLPIRWVDAITVTMVFAILCISVVAVTGLGGQLSLSQFVLAGVGALTAARLSSAWGWPFPIAMLGSMTVSALLGAIVALPALRTRGVSLAIATFGVATVIYALVLNNPRYAGTDLGIAVESPTLLGWSIDPVRHPDRYGVVVLAALIGSALIVCNIRRGTTGRRLLAVRSNERGAAAAGVDVYSVKVYSFVIASALAAAAGVLSSFRNTNVIASSFSVFPSITVVAMTVVGGVGSVGGAIFGATLLQGGVGAELLRDFSEIDRYLPLAGGILLLYTLRSEPSGLFLMNLRLAKRAVRPILAPFAHGASAHGPDDHRLSAGMDDTLETVQAKTLIAENVTVAFGGAVALRNVSIDVRPGELHGLIGSNGAGKTTLIDVVSGFVAPQSGRVALDDVVITGWSPQRRARAGLTRSFQSLELFNDLTVAENLAVATDPGRWAKYLTDPIRPDRSVLDRSTSRALRLFGLESVADSAPESLAFGQRRMVAVARSIAAQPSILLLDEPTSGLDDSETAELGRTLAAFVRSTGTGVLLVEHNVDLVMSICDRVTVMSAGSVVASGDPAAISQDPGFLCDYIGREP